MKRLVLESWLLLLRFEWIMGRGDFRDLYRSVRDEPVRAIRHATLAQRQDLCHAMDLACVLYFKRVLCLQRSAATTLLLRRHGLVTEMVLGAQMLPFKSHAWCESDGSVVNDKPYMREIYAVLERC